MYSSGYEAGRKLLIAGAIMCVVDNGCGFDPARGSSAAAIDARLAIVGSPGNTGVEIALEWPVADNPTHGCSF